MKVSIVYDKFSAHPPSIYLMSNVGVHSQSVFATHDDSEDNGIQASLLSLFKSALYFCLWVQTFAFLLGFTFVDEI